MKRLVAGLWRDVEAALGHDPAARSRAEIFLAYPGVHALAVHRVAHRLWESGHALSARLLSHAARFGTGIEIHPGATIADGVFIDHGMGVVIGETAVVGAGCIIYKGAVLGGTSLERKARHPRLGQNVVVGTNACVLGAIEIGEGARIGSGSVVIRDVPAGATVVGVPGRVVRDDRPSHFAEQLDHASLPDPVTDLIRELASREEALLERVLELERRLASLGMKLPERPARPGMEDDPHRRAGRIF